MTELSSWAMVIALGLLCASDDLRLTLGSLIVFVLAARHWLTHAGATYDR